MLMCCVPAAFLIPYLLAMAVCGVPLFFLELSVCQFSNLGPGRVWVICPLFRGESEWPPLRCVCQFSAWYGEGRGGGRVWVICPLFRGESEWLPLVSVCQIECGSSALCSEVNQSGLPWCLSVRQSVGYLPFVQT